MSKGKLCFILFLLFLNLIIFIFGTNKNKIPIIKTDREPKNEKNELEAINETIAITTIQTQNIISTILSSSDKISEQTIINSSNEITVIQTQNINNSIIKSNFEKNEVMNGTQNQNIISTIFKIHNINSTKIIKQNKTSITGIKINKTTKIKKIGVISVDHGQNVGNNLLKYAMFIKLKELGFEPYIIGYLRPGNNISFLNDTINIRCIKRSFREIKRDDYDILMVNSDQVWRKTNLNYLDVGFLRFASNWDIPKFIYGASFGVDYWIYYRYEERYLKLLLKDFTGISVREEGLKKMVERHWNLYPTLVVDPTLLTF